MFLEVSEDSAVATGVVEPWLVALGLLLGETADEDLTCDGAGPVPVGSRAGQAVRAGRIRPQWTPGCLLLLFVWPHR